MARAIIAVVLIMTSCAGASKGRSRDEWAAARAVAEKHLTTDEAVEEEVSALPFMFLLRSTTRFAVLVHAGDLFERRGVAALDVYLRESRCIEQRLPNIHQMLMLVRLLDAWPPAVENPHAYISKLADEVALHPRLDYLDGGSARVVLYYLVRDTGDDEGEGSDDPRLAEWTLTMDPGQMPVWTHRGRTWNREARVFYDEHGN